MYIFGFDFENSFQFDLNSEIITTGKTNIIDTDNNIYIFENAKINLVSNEILGKELKIDFVDNYLMELLQVMASCGHF